MSQTAAASTSTSSSSSSSLSLRLRPSSSRGHANHGWLNTYHTFSFASFYDPRFSRFHCLRVINEDRVTGGQGFGTHPHSNYEIFSYVVSGALAHKDSLGNMEKIQRGEVQFTSAGTGISHSEFNASPTDFVHFLQIWVKPSRSDLRPRYSTRTFTDAEKRARLRVIVAPDNFSAAKGEEFIPINNDIVMYASILQRGESVAHTVAPGRALYVHLVQDATGFEKEAKKVAISVNGMKLEGGDGMFVERKGKDQKGEEVIIRAESGDGINNEFLLFDIKADGESSAADDDDD